MGLFISALIIFTIGQFYWGQFYNIIFNGGKKREMKYLHQIWINWVTENNQERKV